MTDHVADIKKYAKKPVDEAAVARLAKTYQLVMSKPDAKYVACSDAAEGRWAACATISSRRS